VSQVATDASVVAPSRRNIMRRDGIGRLRLRLLQFLIGLLLLGLWHVAMVSGLVRPSLVSTPRDVLDFLVESSKQGTLWTNLWATLAATLIAFVVGSVAGIIVGLALGVLPTLQAALDPYISALNAMPRIALGPLFLLYFGIGTSAKVALAVSIVIFILMLNTRAGIMSSDPDILRLAAVMGMTRGQRFCKILLPVAVPSIFAGLRLGLVYSLLGVVTAELIASQSGLGALVVYYSAVFNITGIYAILIVLALIASILNMAMVVGERALLRWQPPSVR
jgi:NitT/TauT family transport system permease protein